ncbi:MAG: pyridoxamine 5'-phosphate oxidase family protein [Kofleriaceae bacterium]
MTRTELIPWLQRQPFAVVSSVHADNRPQAAVVGVAVTEALELVFDTLTTSRKYENLRRDARCAVVAWQDAVTVQIEGVVDEPVGAERGRLVAAYLAAFPDGEARAKLPTIAYFRITPSWIRISDFTSEPARVEQL